MKKTLPKIHPLDVEFLIGKNAHLVTLRLKRPWWSFLIPGFSGPYRGELTIRGREFEQDASVPTKIGELYR